MIDDSERREAARRLRMSRSEWSGMGWKLWLGPKFGAVVLSDGNKNELEDAAHRLADLIEPTRNCSEPTRNCSEPTRTYGECDRDAVLELADDKYVTGSYND